MDGTAQPLLIGLLGLLIIAAILLRSGLGRLAVPALVGYLVLGFLLRGAQGAWGFLPAEGSAVLELLGRMGLIALLFRVGLESDVGRLRSQLGRAGPIWLGSVLASGAAGYATARWLLDLGAVPSLFTGVALTATSVGVSLSVWQERDALDTDTGALLVDTVELDDFSGVLLMALLFQVAPLLHGGAGDLLPPLARATAVVLLKAGLFLGGCFLFARYAEARLTRAMGRAGGEAGRILTVTGVGFVIAAVAELLGFSFAIGAFFAGLIFSRDPDSVRLDTSFEELYALLTPFFFIWLGFGLDPGGLGAAAGTGVVLLAAAVLGKVVGTGAPAVPKVGWAGGLALGLSVVPRAEITMVILERGMSLGPWAVPPRLFSAGILVVLVTSALFPVLTDRLLDARPRLAGAS